MIVVTGASGKLGRLVVEQLLKKVPAKEIVAAVRQPAKVADLAARGVQVRQADYEQPATLDAAFAGADKVLLISSSEVGKRLPQHQAAIAAAKRAGVKLLAYTSITRADTSKLALAVEHRGTEEAIRSSGLPFVLLRNSWYLENYTENLQPALAHGVLQGSAGAGRVSAATRADYAAAAAEVLTSKGHEGKVYELGGDAGFSLPELAAELSRQSRKNVAYKDLPAQEFQKALVGFGVPPPMAEVLADSDVGISRGDLEVKGGALGKLIGRPTTPLAAAISQALR